MFIAFEHGDNEEGRDIAYEIFDLDIEKMRFMYFGTQIINRKSSILKRKLITEGRFEDIVRSPNNPHGVLLKDWRIIDNSEISNQPKFSY